MHELLGCLLGISPLGEIPAGAINNNNNNIITPLFTLGSIYSTNASGTEKMLAINNSN